MASRRGVGMNPLGAPEFATLRLLRKAFSSGGVPPAALRTPQDEARIAALFSLHQLLYVLEEFRKASERGEPVRLAVDERGASRSRIVLDISILYGEGEAS